MHHVGLPLTADSVSVLLHTKALRVTLAARARWHANHHHDTRKTTRKTSGGREDSPRRISRCTERTRPGTPRNTGSSFELSARQGHQSTRTRWSLLTASQSRLVRLPRTECKQRGRLCGGGLGAGRIRDLRLGHPARRAFLALSGAPDPLVPKLRWVRGAAEGSELIA